MGERVEPLLLVEMDDRFRVGAREEAMTPLLEPGSRGLEAVELPVVDHHHGAVLVGERLATGRGEVEDRQAAMREPDWTGDEDPLVVGTAMGQACGGREPSGPAAGGALRPPGA